MDFGKLKKKSKIKYKAFYCLEIQPQRFKADNLSCLILDYKRFFSIVIISLILLTENCVQFLLLLLVDISLFCGIKSKPPI